MSQSNLATRFNDAEGSVADGYRAYSTLAVLGLMLGVASPLAFVSPVLYVFAVLGVVVSGLALRRIRAAAPELLGKTLAQLGLLLALICGIGAATRDTTARLVLERDAWAFGNAFYEYLRRGEPEKAYLLTVEDVFRPPLDDEEKLWRELERFPNHQQGLRGFVLLPNVRSILELKEAAQIRPFQFLKAIPTKTPDGRPSVVVRLAYAVTYDEGLVKRTYFDTLELERSRGTTAAHPYEWRLLHNDFGVNPD